MARRIVVELFLMVLAGIVLALTGPFGSYELPLAQRLLLWPLMLLSGYPVFRGLGIVSRWLGEVAHVPQTIAVPLALGVAALPVTLFVALLWFRVPAGALLRAPGLGPLYLQVLIVGLIVHVAMHLLLRPAAADGAALAAATPHAEPQHAAKEPVHALPLPPGFGPVRALRGEDHYVRVIGEAREELILMRMRDAIERLDGVDGLRTHRSWWVAKAAVASVRRDGRTAILTLRSGHEAPVARDMMPQLRAAGWL